MNATLHVLKKDLRQLRPYLILLYLLAVGYWIGFAFTGVAPELSLTLNFGLGGAILVLVYVALRSDSVSESTAWWRTRPISSTQVFLAKLLLWVIGIAVPLCFSVTALAWRYGFSPSQLILANLEVSLVSAALVGLLATWLAIPNLRANIGINIGVAFVFVVFAAFLSLGSLLQHNHLPTTIQSLNGNSLLIGLMALTIGTCGAWAFLACRRRSAEATLSFVVGLFVFFGSAIASTQGRNLAVELSPTDNNRVQLSLVEQPNPPAPNNAHQYLYNHFRLTGLNPREFASVAYLKGTFRWQDGAISQMSDFNGAPGGNSHNFDQRILSQLKPVLFSEYPSDTAWTSDSSRNRQNFFPISMPDKSYQIRSDTIGDLEGTVMANILRLDPQGKFPLAQGIYQMEPGRSLEIDTVDFHWDAIKLGFYITRPKLALSTDPESNLVSPYTNERTRYLFVIFHPDQGEAYLLSHQQISRRSMKTLVPAIKQHLSLDIPFSNLRSAINGLSMKEWVQGAEIHPYKIEIVGIKKHQFSQKDYPIYRDQYYNERTELSLENLTLAEDADETQVRQYLSDVIANIPDRYSNASIQQIRSKIGAIRPEHLPILLTLLPGSEGIVNTYLNRPISQLVRAEHRDAFAKLWETRNDFIHLARRMGWVEQLSQLFLDRVKTREILSPHAVAYAAQAQDPESYSHLKWHFVHSNWGHELMLRELEHCEGFDVNQAIEQAWTRARLEIINRGGLVIPAAERGLPDALGAVANYLTEHDEGQQAKIAERIRQFVDHPELDEPFADWFLSHLDQLSFDEDAGRYRLQ